MAIWSEWTIWDFHGRLPTESPQQQTQDHSTGQGGEPVNMSARTPEAEPLLTPAEVATMFRVDPKTVTRWAKAGKLTSIRTLGGHRRYREAEVRALLAGIPQQGSGACTTYTRTYRQAPHPAATSGPQLHTTRVLPQQSPLP